MRKYSILIFAVTLSLIAVVSLNCGGSGKRTSVPGTGTGTGTGTDTSTGSGTGTSTNTLQVSLGPDSPGGTLTWNLPTTGSYNCITLQFEFEAIGGNVSVVSMVVTDTGDGSLTNGAGIKCNVYEDVGDCAGKYDPNDVKVSGDVAWDNSRAATIAFSSPIELKTLGKKTYIICYLVTPPSYSQDPLYYRSVIPLNQIDAVETGTSLKVSAVNPGGGGDPTGVQVFIKPE